MMAARSDGLERRRRCHHQDRPGVRPVGAGRRRGGLSTQPVVEEAVEEMTPITIDQIIEAIEEAADDGDGVWNQINKAKLRQTILRGSYVGIDYEDEDLPLSRHDDYTQGLTPFFIH